MTAATQDDSSVFEEKLSSSRGWTLVMLATAIGKLPGTPATAKSAT